MTISPSRASFRAVRMAAWRSGSTMWGTSKRRMPTRAAFRSISFVALAGEDDDIAFARFLQGSADGRLAIRLDDVGHVEAADADQGVVHDGQGIFGSRCVAGEDDEVAALRGCLSHEGTLGAVAVAAAAEERNDALWVEPAGHRDDVAQRVVGVRVVHHHDEGLAFIDTLKAPRNGPEIGDAAGDDFGGEAVGEAGRARGENVVDVDLANERRFDGEALFAELQVEAQPAETGSDVARAQIGLRAEAVPQLVGLGMHLGAVRPLILVIENGDK